MKSEHTGKPGHIVLSSGSLPVLVEGPCPEGTFGLNVTMEDPEPKWPDTLEGRIRKWMYDYEDAGGCYDPGLCFESLAEDAKEIIEQLQAEVVTI